MGKGDKKSKKGKLILGSYGKSRPQKAANKKNKPEVAAAVHIQEVAPVAKKKKKA